MPEPQRFDPREQAALLLVQQSIKQQDGGLEFIGRELEGLGRVEASAMAVAGEITEVLQLAEDGEIDRGAEDTLELGQLGNLVAEQVAAEDCRVKSDGSHYVRIPTRGSFL